MRILVINGPNLNRLGVRKPEIYGNRTMAQILLDIQQRWPDIHFVYRQSNHEGDLIDWIQEAEGDGIILNAGGYTHTSVALRDAVEEETMPLISCPSASSPEKSSSSKSSGRSRTLIGAPDSSSASRRSRRRRSERCIACGLDARRR